MPTSLSPSPASPSPASPTAASSSLPRLWAVIPCAGQGLRAGAGGPKQYHAVAGQPMVLHTLAAFAQVPRLAQVLVAVSPGDTFFEGDGHSAGAGAVVGGSLTVWPCGGATRAHTVRNSLGVLQTLGAAAHDWVLVHDAARCLITPAQIEALIDACSGDAVGGLLALPLPDTLKQAQQGRVATTVPRSDKWLAQTPQMFRLGALAQALDFAMQAEAASNGASSVTDESSAMEALGHAPLLVEGSAHNFKVTYPQDFALAEAVLQARGAAGGAV